MDQAAATEIELNIKEARELVNLGKSLDRLESNPNFRRLIRDSYLRDEAVRLVHLKADPSLQEPSVQADIIKDIDAIGGLMNFFRKVRYQAELAGKAIEDNEQALEELAQEGAE